MDIRWLHVEATGRDSVFPVPMTSMVIWRAVGGRERGREGRRKNLVFKEKDKATMKGLWAGGQGGRVGGSQGFLAVVSVTVGRAPLPVAKYKSSCL